VVPFGWSDLLQQGYSHRTGSLFDTAGEFGICDGITVPVRGHRNTISVLSAIPDGVKVERDYAIARYTADLTILASLLHEKLWQLYQQDRASAREHDILTPREREVLQWIAIGKTSYEIGMILGIGETTVNSHAVAICRKLNASSRTHAAVIGALQGLIDPL
jgi:DNA-binding CsgD family transcriptional regulator